VLTKEKANVALLKQSLEHENMQEAATLFEKAVQRIPAWLLQPLHDAIQAMLDRPDVDEQKKLILDFYLDHLQYEKAK
jgi:hypothetical protein